MRAPHLLENGHYLNGVGARAVVREVTAGTAPVLCQFTLAFGVHAKLLPSVVAVERGSKFVRTRSDLREHISPGDSMLIESEVVTVDPLSVVSNTTLVLSSAFGGVSATDVEAYTHGSKQVTRYISSSAGCHRYSPRHSQCSDRR